MPIIISIISIVIDIHPIFLTPANQLEYISKIVTIIFIILAGILLSVGIYYTKIEHKP